MKKQKMTVMIEDIDPKTLILHTHLATVTLGKMVMEIDQNVAGHGLYFSIKEGKDERKIFLGLRNIVDGLIDVLKKEKELPKK